MTRLDYSNYRTPYPVRTQSTQEGARAPRRARVSYYSCSIAAHGVAALLEQVA
eukprot:COSAG02_NODE_48162_length_335_cov_20.118644_1_plen_52_part_01